MAPTPHFDQDDPLRCISLYPDHLDPTKVPNHSGFRSFEFDCRHRLRNRPWRASRTLSLEGWSANASSIGRKCYRHWFDHMDENTLWFASGADYGQRRSGWFPFVSEWSAIGTCCKFSDNAHHLPPLALPAVSRWRRLISHRISPLHRPDICRRICKWTHPPVGSTKILTHGRHSRQSSGNIFSLCRT